MRASRDRYLVVSHPKYLKHCRDAWPEEKHFTLLLHVDPTSIQTHLTHGHPHKHGASVNRQCSRLAGKPYSPVKSR